MKAWIIGAMIGFLVTLFLSLIGRVVFKLSFVAAPLTILWFFFMGLDLVIVGLIAWLSLPIIGALIGLLVSKK
jgi:hypothetical protein